MANLELAQQYFDAWNAHDADAIVKTFADSGTYFDPTSLEISGEAIADYAKSLWTAFPDLSFEISNLSTSGSNRASAQWLMKGTNNGALSGLPPTGKPILLMGADFIESGPNGIISVKGYFDTKAIPEQLGLQVLVQPKTIGSFSFGSSVSVQTGKKVKPGAFSITSLEVFEGQHDEFRELSRETATEMLNMEGFIGTNLIKIGNRGYTISAWEKPEHTKQLMTSSAHRKAMARYWDDLGFSGYTSVWTPFYYLPTRIRCTACNKMIDYEKNIGMCDCGQKLPEPPPYF